jgi:hypothetical protein
VSWRHQNLAHLEERPPVLPTIGNVGLIYPGKRHAFSGLPESAKTLAAYAIVLEEVRSGGSAVVVDFEMGQWDARERLRELSATEDEFERIVYVEPDTPATDEEIAELVAYAPTLVVIDAAAGAYDLQGLDDMKRGDVEKFARAFIREFWRKGIATLVLDHVVKNAKNRGNFTIGSERKLGGIDVHLGFETVTPVTRGGRGLYKITTRKDRGGHLPRPKAGELELRSDPVTHAITWTFRAPEKTAEASPWRPTHLMEKVSRWLELQADGVSRSEVERNVTGTAQYVRAALDGLIADGYVEETAGIRRSRLVKSVEPYRESSASDSVVSASDEVAEPPATASSAARPSRDDADGVSRANGRPLIGDADYLDWLYTHFSSGDLTANEWTELERAHRFVRNRAVEEAA